MPVLRHYDACHTPPAVPGVSFFHEEDITHDLSAIFSDGIHVVSFSDAGAEHPSDRYRDP
jgi:hypothetical protein